MSRSIFSSSPFRAHYGVQPIGPGPRSSYALAQADILDDLGLDDILGDITELTGDLDGVIAKLPVEAAGPFAARRDECLGKSNPLSKYKCLYDLFQDVKKALKDEEDKAAAPKPTNTDTKQPASSFPVVPVVIGGIAAAAILYAVVKG